MDGVAWIGGDMTWRLICVVATLMMLCGGRTSADSFGPPQDSFLVSADERYILVRLLTEAEIARYPEVIINQELRAMYPKSGLYTNDAERRLLWEFAGSLWSEFISADGVYMVGFDGLPYSPDKVVITFYKHGQPFRHYALAELVDVDDLPRTAGGGYPWIHERSFDGATNRITLITAGHRHHSFDLTTGELFARPSSIFTTLLLLSPLALVAFVGVFLLLRNKRRAVV